MAIFFPCSCGNWLSSEPRATRVQCAICHKENAVPAPAKNAPGLPDWFDNPQGEEASSQPAPAVPAWIEDVRKAEQKATPPGKKTHLPLGRMSTFLEALGESQLMEPDQVQRIRQSELAQQRDPRPLVEQLIKSQRLTIFQAKEILQGRGRDLTFGRYKLLDRLGMGGMGQVFKAGHWTTNRLVALKVMHRERLHDKKAVRRFCREIANTAPLHHPNIVQVLDSGHVGGAPFYAMDYVDGIDLSKMVKQSGPLPIALACDYVRQVAEGLQYAHEHDLVHRDIKPANLVATTAAKPGGLLTVKILDMGVARLLGANQDSDLTNAGVVIGTPSYIAPEQALNSHAADIRSDLYSLGCSFFYFLTGRPPVLGSSPTETILAHISEEPPPVQTLRHDVPLEIQKMVSCLLEKKPEARYQKPVDLVEALRKHTR